MVPFAPGDYIDFSGVKVGSEIIAYSITAHSPMVTTTGVAASLYVEDVLLGVIDKQPAANVEFADSRVSGKSQ